MVCAGSAKTKTFVKHKYFIHKQQVTINLIFHDIILVIAVKLGKSSYKRIILRAKYDFKTYVYIYFMLYIDSGGLRKQR